MIDTTTDIINKTQSSAQMLIMSAKAIPADKVDFTPGGKSRSTLSIVSECATFPHFIKTLVSTGAMPAMDGSMPTFATLDEAIAALEASTADICDYIKSVPTDKYSDVIPLPWDPTATVQSILGYQNWNNTYHFGQINTIQLVLGIEDMQF